MFVKKIKVIPMAYGASFLATILFMLVVTIVLQLNKNDIIEVSGTFKNEEGIIFSFELENYKADDFEVAEQILLRDMNLNITYKAVVMRVTRTEYENSGSKTVCDLRILDDECIEFGLNRRMELIRESGKLLTMLFN